MAERLCNHEPCGCEPAPGVNYCDLFCERADRDDAFEDPPDRTRAECRCGHARCHPDNAARFASEAAPVP
jgi:hypothetical protein